MEKLVLPPLPDENVTEEMKNGAFDMDSYILGRRHGIRDCIHYLRQQGYHIEGDKE